MSKLKTQSGKIINLKTTFDVLSKIEASFTGGKIQVSSCGEFLFATCGDKIQVLHIATGRVHQSLAEEDDVISSFALSPDDQFLVTAGQSMLLRQWDWQEAKQTRTWKAIHTAPVSAMTFDPTSTLLATGSSDSTVKVWDIIKQYCTHNLKGSQGVISAVQFHPNPECLLLFSAADDHKIRIWDLLKSRCISILEGHFSVVTSLTFSHDFKTLVSSGRDKVVNVWDLPNRKLHKTIPVFESVESVVMLPKDSSHPGSSDLRSEEEDEDDEEYFLTGGSKGFLRVWNLPRGKCVYPLKEFTGKPYEITHASISHKLNSVVVTTFDHNVIFYDVKSLEMNKQLIGYNDEILDIKFVGAADSHIAMATNSDQLRVYDRETLSCQLLQAHSDIILSVDVNVSGNMLITSSKDNTIRLWYQDKGSALYTCVGLGAGHTHAVGAVAWSRLDSAFVVSGSQDCTIKVWIIPQVINKDSVSKLSVKFTEKAHDKDINSIAVSPNDKMIVSGSQDKTAKVWQVSDGSLLGVLRGHKRGLWCVQFSPIDQCIATSSGDGTIKLWAVSSFSCIKTLQGHTNSVLKVAFVTRGMQLLSSGSDGLIKLWTIKTNECVQTLDEHLDKVWTLAVSKTEDVVISGGSDSTFILWKDNTEIEAQKEHEATEEQILKEQELSNLLQNKMYKKALALAISLNQPFRALSIIKDILNVENGESELTSAISSLREDQIDLMLKFVMNWNTNSKHCYIAQAVLSVILRSKSPSALMERPDIKDVLEGLLPYTERHFERMNRLLQQSMFLDYCWKAMKLSPESKESGSSLQVESREESTTTEEPVSVANVEDTQESCDVSDHENEGKESDVSDHENEGKESDVIDHKNEGKESDVNDNENEGKESDVNDHENEGKESDVNDYENEGKENLADSKDETEENTKGILEEKLDIENTDSSNKEEAIEEEEEKAELKEEKRKTRKSKKIKTDTAEPKKKKKRKTLTSL